MTRALLPVLVSALALSLAACGGGPRPLMEAPPPLGAPPSHPRPVAQHPTAPPVRNAAPPAAPVPPLNLARVESYMDGLETDLRRHVHGAVIARQGDNITVTIRNDQLFTPDGGVAGDDLLEPLGAILRNYPHTHVAVNGYTDTAGKPEQNLAVSQKRAQLIAAALAHEGVAPARLSAQGYGETHLRVATGDDRKEPRNRRIEIILHPVPG